ncbi:MAG: ComEC/Rec2 family competence protein [Elusimicrobiales bacterium]|nr:ComEC/Rec2 family competence protein [Elusimicrobiales bacterium]
MKFSYYFRPVVIFSILLIIFIYLITPLIIFKKNVDYKDDKLICGLVKSYHFKSYDSYYFYLEGEQTFLVKSDKDFNFPLYTQLCIRGDIEEISSKEYFGNFSWKKYMNMKNIFWQIELKEVVKYESTFFFEMINKIRGGFINFIEDNFIDKDVKAIIMGLVLGNKQNLSKELKDAINNCGIMHLMVASGSNISYFMGVVGILCRFFGIGRKTVFLISLFFGLLYVALIGFEPPITRAYLMIFFGILFYFMNRNIDSFQILSIVFVFSLLTNPLLIYDPSFVMSFLAVYGIIVGFMNWGFLFNYDFKILKIFPSDSKFSIFIKEKSNKIFKGIIFIFLMTIFSQLALSIYIYTHFYKFSVVSFVSNIFFIPFSSIIITASMLNLVLYFMLASFSIGFLEYLVKTFIKLVYFFSSFKYSILYFSPNSDINAILIFIFILVILHLPIIDFSKVFSRVFFSVFVLFLFISFLWRDSVKDDLYIEVGKKRVWFIERNFNYYLIDPIVEADKIINMIYASRRNRVDYILISSYSSFREKNIDRLKAFFDVKKIYLPLWLCEGKNSNYYCIFGGEEGDGFKAIFRDKYGYFNVYSALTFCFNDRCF